MVYIDFVTVFIHILPRCIIFCIVKRLRPRTEGGVCKCLLIELID